MAEARQRAEWLRVGVAVAWIVSRNGWSTEPISPLAVIPAAYRPPLPPTPPMSAEQRAADSRRAWHVLDRFFGK